MKKIKGSDETELFFCLNTNHNWTETDMDDIDVKSQLEHQTQIQETKKSGWILLILSGSI